MKLKKPGFMNNITRKMVIVWVVLFVSLLVIGFGTASLVLVLQRKDYGAEIRYGNIHRVYYANELHPNGRELLRQANQEHSQTIQEILHLLARGHRTNNLSNLFRGNPVQQVNQSTTIQYTSTVRNQHSAGFIAIQFAQPMFGVQTISRTEFSLVNIEPTAVATQTLRIVYGIFIPLNNTSDRFQAQTWHLVTQSPLTTRATINDPLSSLHIGHNISTYGNYHRLWNFISELSIL